MIRVVVVSRLFSGFVDSVGSGEWRPTGAPTIYKLLEGLADDPEIELIPVFTCRDAAAWQGVGRRRYAPIARLGATARILPYRRSRLLMDVLQLLACISIWRRQRPEAAYFTNANFLIGAAFARLGLCRTVLRFMGLTPFEKSVAVRRGGIFRWLYRAPWDHVVCTQEGSGAEYFLDKLLRPEVKRSIVINGVDVRPRREGAGAALLRRHGLEGRPLVLFVGRLEDIKGCAEFVDAMLTLLARRPGVAYAVAVGEGSMREMLARRISEAGMADDIRLAGGVAHDELPDWYAAADLYVSLNKYGNLSNANLEALAAGCCMVMPAADPETRTDLSTDELIPPSAAPRVARDDLVAGTAAVIEALLDDPDRRAACAKSARRIAEDILGSWDERIRLEISVIRGESSQPARQPVPAR